MKDRWSQLSMSEKSDLMSLYIQNGISSLEEIKKHYNSFAQGGSLPDHDPNNPYHYHNAAGNKIVITPEEWEVNVGKPYFREIENAVRAEQAAYPEPEYEINPNFVRDLRSTYSYNMGNGYQNYRNFSSSLPQGYNFTDEGLIVDSKGNYYVQSGYRQSPRFTYNTDNPLQFTINKGKPIERNLTFYPVNMDKRVKAPIPVDRVMNVNNEREKAIENYIETNTTPKQRINYINSALVSYLYPDLATGSGKKETQRGINEAKKLGFKYILDNYIPDQYNSWLIGFTDNEFEKFKRDLWDKTSFLNPDGSRYISIDGNYYDKKDFFDPNWYVSKDNPTIKHSAGWRIGPNGNMGFQTRYIENKPSNQEAEKKAVISIGPLEKVNTFAVGGHLYQDEGPDDDKYSFLRREPEVAIADNTRVVMPIDPYTIAQARDEYEAQQRQVSMMMAAQNQPQLRADTRTDSDRKREAQRREKQAKLDATRAAQRDFMSLGRPNTESQQAAVIATPYIAEITTDYLKNNNIARDLGYFIPGVNNVLMAQDANEQIDNNQYGWAALYGLGALSPVAGLTPNFKSTARYIKSANKVGDWTILDYGRTKNSNVTTQPQLTSKTTLQLTPTRNVDVTPTITTPTNIQQLSYNSTRGIPKTNSVITPKQINLPEKFVNFVDKNGNIDTDRFTEFWKYVANQYGNNYVDGYRIDHSINVAKSAQQLPLPKGITRKDYVQAALLHDIGTAIEGHSDTHGQAGANIMKKIAGTQLSPAQYEAIEKHMDNTSYGKGRDLLKAVEAADAARGQNLAEAIVFHPNLMTYKFEPQFNYTGQKAAENFRDDLKSRVNPILKQTGLGTIPLNSSIQEATQLLNDKTRQWRTLLRGARDPKGTSMSFGQERRNVENAEKLAKKYYGEDIFNLNPEFYRTLITTQTIPLEDSGGGRAGFRDARHALDLDKNIYDALYASNSASVATGYKTGTGTSDGRLGLARKVYLPFEEYSGEMLPSEWMIDNFDWDLLDQNRKGFKSGEKQYGLTRFSQFDIPYRLQTGKSFMTDYGNFIGKQNMFDVQKTKLTSAPYEMTEYYNSAYKDINEINNILNNFGFKPISPFNEDASIIYRIPKNNTLKRLLNDIIDLPDDSLKNISDETVKDKAFFALSELKAYDLLSKAQYQKRNYLKFDKRNLIKKALDEYYTKQKAQFRPTPIFKDQGNMMEFMLKQGVEPRVLNKNFLSTLAVNTGGKPLPEGSPLFFKKDRDSNQLSIIAPKGSKIFEDLGELDLDDYFNGIIVGKRHDFGHRSFDVTTKFNKGGKLNGR